MTEAESLRAALRANLFDGDEGGTITMPIAQLLTDIVEIVQEFAATPPAEGPTVEQFAISAYEASLITPPTEGLTNRELTTPTLVTPPTEGLDVERLERAMRAWYGRQGNGDHPRTWIDEDAPGIAREYTTPPADTALDAPWSDPVTGDEVERGAPDPA